LFVSLPSVAATGRSGFFLFIFSFSEVKMQPSYHSTFKTRPGGRPGPRPGFQVLTGSVLFFFLKSKRRRFSKKKVSGFATGSWLGLAGSTGSPGQPTGSAGSHRVFSPRCFFNLAWFQPQVGRVLGRPAGPGRVSKLCSVQVITTCY